MGGVTHMLLVRLDGFGFPTAEQTKDLWDG